MSVNDQLANLSMPRKLLLGAGVFLLICSFLPWYHVSIGGLGGASANGWHGVGVVTWLLVIALLAVEGSRIAGVLPLKEGQAELASLGAAGGAVVFGVIYVIARLSDGYLGFGFYLGLIGLVVLAYGAFGLYRSGAAVTAFKDIQSSSGTDTD